MKKHSILIVEDEVIVSMDLSIRIRQLGYEVIGPTATGEEAIALADKHRPSLVLMDIRLQGEMDGIQAAKEIRCRFRLPVVFLTAYAENGTLQRAKLAEPLGYILKPFEDQEMATIIEIAIYKHQIERQLQESEERFRTLAALAPVGIYLTDAAGVCQYANARWCEMAGMTLEETLGDGWLKSLHPDDWASFQSGWKQMVASEGHWAMEYRLQTTAGKVSWVYGLATPQRDALGQIIGYIGVGADITERKRADAERESLAAQNRILQKAESLGLMAGAIAHHFNNQLQGVMGNLELAQQALPADSETGANLAAAMQSARKAAELSSLMLTYLGHTHARHVPLDFSETCRKHLPILLVGMPKHLVLNSDFPQPGPVITASENEVQQVLTNLITNAWEASASSREPIRVSLRTVPAAEVPKSNFFPIDCHPASTDHACLEIADGGCGIPQADIEKLFDPFFSSKFVGRGMGLPVVLGIMRSHGGFITVASEPGRGTTVRVFIPMSVEALSSQPTPATTPAQAAPTEPIPKTPRGNTVLVIDDEPSVRRTVALALRHLGFPVLSAEDGVSGVSMFQAHKAQIGCVLSDLTMPRMSGWETLTALRRLSPGIPVILASGYDEAQVMAGDHDQLPQAFLRKPYELNALNDALKRVFADAEH